MLVERKAYMHPNPFTYHKVSFPVECRTQFFHWHLLLHEGFNAAAVFVA